MASNEKNDLTQGSVVKQLIRYSIPLITTSVFQALYSMVDLFLAGKYIGSTGISAINNASQIITIVTNVIIGLSLGGNILIGQYFGSKDEENQQKTTGTFFTLFFILGIAISAACFIFTRPILQATGAPALNEAAAYLKICSIGLFFVLGYNAFSAVLRAVGNSKWPMYFILTATIVNIILDMLLMGYMNMGTAGAALATTIAQGISFVLALIYLLKHQSIFKFSIASLQIRIDKLKQLLKIGFPCSIQWTVAGISWLTVTFIINSYGVDVSAGNGISNKIRDFTLLFINSMSASAGTMIAQTLGAKLYDRAKQVMYEAMRLSIIITVVMIILVQLFAPALIGIFTNDPAVTTAGVLNLRIEIFGQLAYACFLIYHSLATGAGHTPFVLLSSFVNCIIFRMTLSIIFNHLFGLPGLYVALAFAPFTSIPIGMIYTKSNIWRKSMVAT